MSQSAKEILDTMLGYLGFVVNIEEQKTNNAVVLQIFTNESDRLIGEEGRTLNEIQNLLNRLVFAQDRQAPRVVVDVEHYRTMQEDDLVQRVRRLAERVRTTGKSVQLGPMNSYDRYIVHNLFKDDPEVATWSPKDDARVKRIVLKKRDSAGK